MTLQELKDKKNVFSNISNEELIGIFNEVLKLNKSQRALLLRGIVA